MSERRTRNDGRQDMARGVAELMARLPPRLHALARLAYNYRWTWLPGGGRLFADIDPGHWRLNGCNPRAAIEAASPARLEELAKRGAYLDRMDALSANVKFELHHPPAFSSDNPIVYFCSEFGVHCSLPLYGGGLGVLAGDMLKTASDLGLPMVGVGLLYRQGYFHQRLDQVGWQLEYWTNTVFERLPAARVTGPDQRPLTVSLSLRGRKVRVQIWRVDVGRVPLYLLDTNREDNHPIDRWITARLYVGDRHTRLAQYAVLGIGGVRALDAMGMRPSLIHLNEGHAALSSFERLRRLLCAGQDLDQALGSVRQKTVFTTHTPVAAGNEGYTEAEVEAVLGDFIGELSLSRDVFYDLGRVTPGDRQEPVNITPLALRTSRAANGVSRRHGEIAREMWRPIWHSCEQREVPITHVTNGVHTMTWMSGLVQQLLDRHLGLSWREVPVEPAAFELVQSIPDDELWNVRCALRAHLVELIRERSVEDRLSRGESPEYVEAAASAFDPQVLTIGFARRVATYKRLYLLTRFPDRARHLLTAERPVQLVIAGKAHPQDHEAKETLRGLFQSRADRAVAERVDFLENYDLHVAPTIMAGVDLWLNLPRPPLEASGTSGMKVAVNGGLNLSVLDGWWLEGYDGENGWAITSPRADAHDQDNRDAAEMFDLLEREIIPLFYDRDAAGVPRGWLKKVKRSMQTLIPSYAAARMVHDYVEKVYRAAGGETVLRA